MSSETTEFQLHDAVTVTLSSNTSKVDGVVAYIGAVEFDTEHHNTDWIGVRLTGKSVGQGQHDGMVQNKRYFDAPAQSGIFVQKSNVRKRTLTKLEELRLRRELSTITTTSTIVTSSTTQRSTPPRNSQTANTSTTPIDAPTPLVNETETSTPVKSKIEELRLRRAALKAKQQQLEMQEKVSATQMTSSSSNNNSPTKQSASSQLLESNNNESIQKQHAIDSLNEQLKTAQSKVEHLTEQLTTRERTITVQSTQLIQLESTVQELRQLSKPTDAITGSTEQSSMEQEMTQLRAQYEETDMELDRIQKQYKQLEVLHNQTLHELTRCENDFKQLQQQEQQQHSLTTTTTETITQSYKERAKIQAESSTWQRLVTELQQEKMELEANIEDLVLDKEQLQEEKEQLMQENEELKLDAETAQMEMEELRMNMPENDYSHKMNVEGGSINEDEDESKNITQEALQTQNTRLRQALIRLREQSALEGLEWNRQIRALQNEVQEKNIINQEMIELRDGKTMMQQEIHELKDMVEQGSALEGMVEEMSDRILMLEEDNIALQAVIRELEEAAELTAEMEEVQSDEIKGLTQDLESRDMIIRNLEEAIRIQRRRDDDFRRTVSNYKATVDTLMQEKQALLELQQGGEGEKSNLIASSQKALARAAQLVADAVATRQREAQSVLNHLEGQMSYHLATRLEDLLPQSIVSTEIVAIKGELMASKVVDTASATLNGIMASFCKNIRPPLPQDVTEKEMKSLKLFTLKLNDENRQEILTMLNETEFAQAIAEISSDVLRLLVAGQWPDLLSADASIELGVVLGHTMPTLDHMLAFTLKTLKEEGSLTVEQSNLGELQLAIQTTLQNLRHDIEREDETIVSPSWNPPGWKLLKQASLAKILCLGAASALSIAVDAQPEGSDTLLSLFPLYSIVEQCSSQAMSVCLRFDSLDLQNEKLLASLLDGFSAFLTESDSMLKLVRKLLLSGDGLEMCHTTARGALTALSKVLSTLRAENLISNEKEHLHVLSPETNDAWFGVAKLARTIRAIDGDSEDVNFLLRAHSVEHRLVDAVEKEPLLTMAQAKVASLEKVLASRSKEIAMQNARLSELEIVVAKSNSTPIGGRNKNFDFASSEEYNNLKEENRVLTEAIDVMQREIELYENEIRSLKDFKSPGKKGKGTPRRSTSDLSSSNLKSIALEDPHTINALEATLFRPALQQAIQDAARWKASAIATAMLNLPPLPTLGDSDFQSFLTNDWICLSAATTSARIQKASLCLIDLTNTCKTPRAQLRELNAKRAATDHRLVSIVTQYRGRMK